MARLPRNEKTRRKSLIASLIHFCGLGLSEQEIAEETGLDGRTINNYLHELDNEERAHREGARWFPY